MTLMKCGHAANAHTQDGRPVCAICTGIRPGADEVDDSPPNLAGRTARCSYYDWHCQSQQPSDPSLPFFAHHSDRPFDEYYCGCYGWD